MEASSIIVEKCKEIIVMMKSTGIVRRVDELGRVVLPKELRTIMNIEEKDGLEIYVNGEQIILRKYEPACIFCGNAEQLIDHHGKKVCRYCLAEITKNVV